MQSANLAFVISQAQDRRQKGAIGLAVASSIEVGVVVPSILRRNLEEAGFGLVTDTRRPCPSTASSRPRHCSGRWSATARA